MKFVFSFVILLPFIFSPHLSAEDLVITQPTAEDQVSFDELIESVEESNAEDEPQEAPADELSAD